MPAGAGNRLGQLDGIRGLAALVVVFCHYVQVVPESVRYLAAFPHKYLDVGAWLTLWPWLRLTPLRLVIEGQAAVDIFFVLSGFVLALGVRPGWQMSYWRFLTRRLCRVYLPFASVILLGVLAYAWFPPAASDVYSHWLNGMVPEPRALSLNSVERHLLMIGATGNDTILDPVIWTLIHEIRMSFILPFLFLSLLRFGTLRVVIVCLGFSLLFSVGLPSSVSGTWQASAHFLWMFAIGSAMSVHRGRIAGWVAAQRRTSLLAGWCVVLAIMSFQFDHDWSDFSIGTGAALLIALALPWGAVPRILVSMVPRWLGRVSYSLYLTHFPVLILTVCSLKASPVAAFVIALIVAELAYRLIEAPSHRLGLWLTKERPGPTAATVQIVS